MENGTTTAQAPETATLPTDEETKMVIDQPKSTGSAERRIYTFHKVYGTCITVSGRVYIAPPEAQFEKKVVYRDTFKFFEGFCTDSFGRVWLDGGENGGCGPRRPEALKELYTAPQWHSLSRAERLAIVKALVPAKNS